MTTEKPTKEIDQEKGCQDDLQITRRFLTFLLDKKVPPIPSEDERKPLPISNASFISKLFFWWMGPLLLTGYKRKLHENDFWKIEGEDSVEVLTAKFEKAFKKRLLLAKKQYNQDDQSSEVEPSPSDSSETRNVESFEPPKYILIMSLVEAFGRSYFWTCCIRLFSDLLSCFTPLLVKELIKISERDAAGLPFSKGSGVGYSIGVTIFVFIRGLAMAHYFNQGQIIGIKMKAVLTKVVYDKSFKLTAEDRQSKFPGSKIISIMTQDLARAELSLTFLGNLLVFPIDIVVAIILLCINIGATGLIGILVFAFGLFLIVYFSKKLMRYRKEASKFTDLRIKTTKEVLNNFKMVKFHSWENSYLRKIKGYRYKEMDQIRIMEWIRGIVMALSLNLPAVSAMITFVCMYNIDGMKSVADIFTGISYFGILSSLALLIPMSLSTCVDAYIGLTRVRDMLVCDNEELVEFSNDDSKNNIAISITNGEFQWKETDTNKSEEDKLERTLQNRTFTGLNNINISIQKGEFIAITGAIGSGKSSLLSAISKGMKMTSGSLDVNGSLLLCGQPWIQNGTVRENIIFGNSFNHEKFQKVVEACSLSSDFDQLPDGEFTYVGERGITLSGGQKARINLARSVYSKTDILLLDDVLSAVDAKVGNHIMNDCILGLLSGKTRVLATHQLSLIGAADRVIFMNMDGTIDIGSIEYLKESNSDFERLMMFNNEVESNDSVEEDELPVQGEKRLEVKTKTLHTDHDTQTETILNDAIDSKVYIKYLQLASGIFGVFGIPLFLLLSILSVFASLFTNVWLAYWTNLSFGISNSGYQGIYALITCMALIISMMSFVLDSYMTNTAAKRLHMKSLDKIILAPMSFMDTTPMGRILNRFTKDTDVADNQLGSETRMLIYVTFTITGVLILCICYIPYFAIVIPLLFFMYFGLSSFYVASSRDINRLDAAKRSMVFNNLNESLDGMQTIKAYGSSSVERFKSKNCTLIDKMNEISIITACNQRWLAVYLTFVATTFCLIISLFCVFNIFHISPSDTGVILTYALQISNYLSFAVRSLTVVEGRMSSVERLVEYAYELPSEKQGGELAPDDWPNKGHVTFNDVSMRYRPELPLVLKNCNLNVKGSSRLGVCGRTGAGKSTILSTLYRITELESGSVVIDGIDISSLKLESLRSRLSIIPQDPLLFDGTIRENLDPFNERTDEELWDAMRRCGLIDGDVLEKVIQQKFDLTNETNDDAHKFHLDQFVHDVGSNFSLGERQLLALARALVRRSKILILDEATSSVDYETDYKTQETLQNEFSDCTILCIAHRLKTIINYDKILVLESGEVNQFGDPRELFEKDGIFREMCINSGIQKSDFYVKKAN